MNTPRLPATLAAAALGLFLSGCQQTYFHALNLGVRDGMSVRFDADDKLSLDVYRPAVAHEPAPVVVFFYGGSWTSGERAYYRFVGQALAQRGMLVLIPDYRKAPAHPFPAFMLDAAKATAWSRAHAKEFGGDPARIYLMGHSAGAHIAALLATDGRFLGKHGMKPRDLAGVIGLAGPYDFLPLTEPAVMQALGPASGWPQTQPVNFVDGDEPPFLLLQGDRDTRVDPANSQRLAARLRDRGDTVTVTMVPGVGHLGLVNGFYSAKLSPVLRDSVDWIRAGQATLPTTTAGRDTSPVSR